MAEPDRFDPSTFAILVVDDEVMNRDMLCRRLDRRGYFTLSAADGQEALDLIEGTGCDLVLLDVQMPGMSGIEVLEAIRAKRGPDQLPVIMASARSDTDIVTTALAKGANDYVAKPLDFPIVLARVQTQLAMRAAVEALKATEARYRMLAELSADMISLHGPDGRFQFASPACRELLGYEPEEMLDLQLFELFHPKDREALPTSAADFPEAATLVLRLRRKDAVYVWVEMKIRAQRGSRSGKVTDLQCSTRDVSFYVDAWASPPVEGAHTPLPVQRIPTHPDVAASVMAHRERLVAATEEPPPIRRKKP